MKKAQIKNYSLALLGVVMTAYGYSQFYLHAKIVSGGVTGVSTILYHTLKIAPGLSFAVINVLLLLLSFKTLGKAFVANTLLGSGLMSIFTELFAELPSITDDPFLCSVFGGVFYGFGVGLALVYGASTGGTDILARLVQHFFPHAQIGTLLLAIDTVVIVAGIVTLGNIELALFGIVSLFISSFGVNYLIRRLNVSKLAFAITDKGEECAKKLIASLPRGITLINASGAYSGNKKKMLISALKEKEIPNFQKILTEIDPDIFIIYSESQQIFGNGFHIYH
jgi:uncharacterized membrane-anchored protein YitT (DUF2179 family)